MGSAWRGLKLVMNGLEAPDIFVCNFGCHIALEAMVENKRINFDWLVGVWSRTAVGINHIAQLFSL